MFTHDEIWQALDTLAQKQGLSASGLARQAGLDATSFNPSKRYKPDGRPRWPSTESLSKVLTCQNMTLADFVELTTDIAPSTATSSAGANDIPSGSIIHVPIFSDNLNLLDRFLTQNGTIRHSLPNGASQTMRAILSQETSAPQSVWGIKLETQRYAPRLFRYQTVIFTSDPSELGEHDIVATNLGQGTKLYSLKTMTHRSITLVPLDSSAEQKPIKCAHSDLGWLARAIQIIL